MKNSPLVQEFIPSWTNGLFFIDFLLSFATSTSISPMLAGPIVGEAFHKEVHVKMGKISPSLYCTFFASEKGYPKQHKNPVGPKRSKF